MPPSKSVAHHRARVAINARFNPDTPEHDAARRDLKAATLREYIQRVVSTWPPLTEEQRVRLAELLAPARQAIREHRLDALQAQPAEIP